jgi:hypothetical protein
MAEGFLGGLGDFVTGGGVYSDPKAINPTYGVPEGDVRQAAINQLGQMSALLLAAGQPMEGSQRAQLLSQIGGTGNQFNTNLYNAAQRRLMTGQMQEKQRETEELNVLRDLQQKDPEGLAKRLGPNYTAEIVKSMPAGSLRDIVKSVTVAQLSRDPLQQQANALNIMKTQRELNTPIRQEIGGKLYEYNEGAKEWKLVAAGNPPGGLEGESQALILRGMRDPAFVETPEYSIAYSRLYGPKTEIRNGEVVQIQPSIPSGVVQPRVAATAMPSAPPAPAPAPQQGQATPPAVVQPPTGGETRTITTPGGGSVSVTSTQPRALSAAEITLKSEAETNIQGLRLAESALRQALQLSPKAYAGPFASERGAIAGATNVDSATAVATRQFNNIMTEQALAQLRPIFGGSPTEGERKVLLENQSRANISRPEREAILERAIETVQARLRNAEKTLSEVSRGEYGRVQPSGSSVPPAASAPPLPPGFQVVR